MTTTLLRRARRAPDAPPQGVLVAGGLVASVGPVDDTAGAAEIIDLDGRFVLPGLWDRHVHFDQWVQVRARIDLSHADSAAGAARVVAAFIAQPESRRVNPVVG